MEVKIITDTTYTFFIGGLVIGFFGLLSQNSPCFWFSGLFPPLSHFFLRSTGGLLKAVWFICPLKPDHTAKTSPYAPLLAVRFIGGVVSNCNEYTD